MAEAKGIETVLNQRNIFVQSLMCEFFCPISPRGNRTQFTVQTSQCQTKDQRMPEKFCMTKRIFFSHIHTSVGFSTIYGSSSALSLSSVGASTCIGSTTFCCGKGIYVSHRKSSSSSRAVFFFFSATEDLLDRSRGGESKRQKGYERFVRLVWLARMDNITRKFKSLDREEGDSPSRLPSPGRLPERRELATALLAPSVVFENGDSVSGLSRYMERNIALAISRTIYIN